MHYLSKELSGRLGFTHFDPTSLAARSKDVDGSPKQAGSDISQELKILKHKTPSPNHYQNE